MVGKVLTLNIDNGYYNDIYLIIIKYLDILNNFDNFKATFVMVLNAEIGEYCDCWKPLKTATYLNVSFMSSFNDN